MFLVIFKDVPGIQNAKCEPLCLSWCSPILADEPGALGKKQLCSAGFDIAAALVSHPCKRYFGFGNVDMR